MIIHPVEITIGRIDNSVANFDPVFKRAKGPLPETVVTVYGQVNSVRQDKQEAERQGDAPRIDGYVYLDKPVAYVFKKGDMIRTVEGRSMVAEIIEVRDESAYGVGTICERLDFRKIWDAQQ